MAKGYPHRQNFNIKDKQPNKTKRRAWWQLGNKNVIQQPKTKD